MHKFCSATLFSLLLIELIIAQNHPWVMLSSDSIPQINARLSNPNQYPTLCKLYQQFVNKTSPWVDENTPHPDKILYTRYSDVAFRAMLENNTNWKLNMIEVAKKFNIDFNFPSDNSYSEDLSFIPEWRRELFNAPFATIAAALIFDYCYDILTQDPDCRDIILNYIYTGMEFMRPFVMNRDSHSFSDWRFYKYNSGHGKTDAGFVIGALAIVNESLSNGTILYPQSRMINDLDTIYTNLFDTDYGFFKYMWGDEGVHLDGSVYFGINFGRMFLLLQALSHYYNENYFNIPIVKETLGKVSKWMVCDLLPNRDNGYNFFMNPLNTSATPLTNSHVNLLVLAEKYKDGKARWLFDEAFGTDFYFNNINISHPEVFIPSIILYKDFPPQEPQIEDYKLFVDYKRGQLNWRTGWNFDDLLFTIESTPVYHKDEVVIKKDQSDKGSITLTAYGRNFIYDPGGGGMRYHNITDNANNYINVWKDGQNLEWTGEANGGGNGFCFTDGKISNYENTNFYDMVKTDNTNAFNYLYYRRWDELRIHHKENKPRLPLNDLAFTNTVLKAEREVFYLKETSKIPYYFWLIDDIQKDLSPSNYNWHVCTRSFYTINKENNPIKIFYTGDPTLDLFMIFPEHNAANCNISDVASDDGIPNTNGKKISIYQNSVINGYFNILLVPYKSSLPGHTYDNFDLTNGTGGLISWTTGYEDCFFHSLSNSITGQIINSDAKHVFLRKNVFSNKVIQYFMREGSYVNYSEFERPIINLYGSIARVFNDSQIVKVYCDEIENILLYAPYATKLFVNDNYIPFTRDGDFIQADHSFLLASQNKSTYNTATFSNNARHLVKAGGKLHEVFDSGGEIFYRRSADNGKSWEIIKRLSDGNGNYSFSCITASILNMLHVVFQKKLTSNIYNLYYAWGWNNGSSWSTASTLSDCTNITVSSWQKYGIMPVITYLEGIPPLGNKLMVVYCSSTGLKYLTSLNYGSTWSIVCSLYGAYNNFVWFPSLSVGENIIALTYDYRFYGVYSRIYNGSSWSNEISPSTGVGTIQDRYSSVAVDPERNILASWCAQREGDPDYRIVFRYGFSNNTWSDLIKEFLKIEGINSQCPSITYYNKGENNLYGIDIIHFTSDKTIRLKKYDIGTLWNDDIILYENGLYANLTIENITSGYPSFIWTDQNGPSYKIFTDIDNYVEKLEILNSSKILQRRAVVNSPDSIIEFSFDLGPIYYTTANGNEVPISFTEYDFRSPISLNSKNIWNYLETDTFFLPTDTIELNFEKSFLFSVKSDSMKKSNIRKFLTLNYQLMLIDVNTNTAIAILDSDKTSGRKSILINNSGSNSFIIKPLISIQGNSINKFTYGLVDVIYPMSWRCKNKYKNVSSICSFDIKQFRIFQNYPNPFNSATNINYVLPEKCFVKLCIYNILGEKIITLINTYQEKGNYTISWYGNNQNNQTVGSGIYIYHIEAVSVDDKKQYKDIRKMIYLK